MPMAANITLLGLALLAASVVMLVHSYRGAPRANLDRRLARLTATGDAVPQSLGWVKICERVLTTSARDREEIAAGLQAAGRESQAGVALFALLRLGICTVGAGAGAIYAASSGLPGGRIVIYAISGGAVGFLATKSLLRARGRAGQRQVYRELPFLLDTLLLLLESGISLDQSFRYLVQQRLGGLDRTRRTLVGLVDDLQNGMAYDLALMRWADRLAVPGARDLAGLFGQALLHGTEIGPALREYIREFTDRRTAGARAGVGKKTTMMTAVLVIFLMPAVMIMLAGPAVVTLKGALAKVRRQATHLPVLSNPPQTNKGGRP